MSLLHMFGDNSFGVSLSYFALSACSCNFCLQMLKSVLEAQVDPVFRLS